MLVLTRRENQSIVIDGRIKVTVLEIRGSQIRLGIEAPHDTPIWREELIVSAAKPVAKGSVALPTDLEPFALAH